AVSGILFNHESPLRGLDFVTRKITNAVAKIKLGLCKELILGNVYAVRDWGLASEYMEGVVKMMELDEPQDFVLATGESATVLNFAYEAIQHVGLHPEVIKTDKKYCKNMDSAYSVFSGFPICLISHREAVSLVKLLPHWRSTARNGE
ncbi:MAG: GDP-mannose 4,6-dehydratase, partial [Patescibacteria group bacterium]